MENVGATFDTSDLVKPIGNDVVIKASLTSHCCTHSFEPWNALNQACD